MNGIMEKGGRGTLEKECAYCESLRVFLEELMLKYERRKGEVLLILEELMKARKKAFLSLEKTRAFARHLTMGQRRNLGGPFLPLPLDEEKNRETGDFLRSALSGPSRLIREGRGVKKNLRELRRSQVFLLAMIDGLKKNLLGLDLLELRINEVILSLQKAAEAFGGEYRRVRFRLFPLGLFSGFLRGLRRFFGGYYFSERDCGELGVLGDLGLSILKIAASPVY
jgi:hypothetical protein